MARTSKKKAAKKRAPKASGSQQWNEKNPDRVQAARERYAEKERARRANLSDYDRLKDDLWRVLRRAKSPAQRKRLLTFALKHFVDKV